MLTFSLNLITVHGSNTLPNAGMEVQIENSAPDSTKSPKKKYKNLADPAFLIQNLVPPALKPLLEPDLHRDVP